MWELLENKLSSFGRCVYRKLCISRDHTFNSHHAYNLQSSDQGNETIANAIKRGEPCMIARLGFSEVGALLNHEEIKIHLAAENVISRYHSRFKGYRQKWDEKTLRTIHFNAGVFPQDPHTIEKFSSLFIARFSKTDVLAAFGIPGEQYLRTKYCPNSTVVPLSSLEPFRHKNPWSMQLENKKVLVVHPFATSIREQYKKREMIFNNPLVLPRFELTTLKAVQSIAGNTCKFHDWFGALKWMESEMENIDFDICIVGAGAYGLPLAAHAKKLGKIAIHMGGALQLLFGIKGSRWENHVTDISNLFNDSWIRPDGTERPSGSETIESGCYW